MNMIQQLLKVLLVSLFINLALVIGSSSCLVLAADGDSVTLGDGVTGWCTVTGPGTGECFNSPTRACHRQWEVYVDSPYNPFIGYEPTEFSNIKRCNWITKGEGGNWCVLPTNITFWCESGYEFIPPNRCVKKQVEEHCTSGQGGTPLPTGGTNPILLSTGAKIEQELDFSTQDGLLQVRRYYRSFMAGNPNVYMMEPLGMGYGWRLDFLYELQLARYFPNNGNISVFLPDGTSYDFKKQENGTLKSSDVDANQVHLKLEFEGEWPTNLEDVHEFSTNWKLTFTNGKVVRFKTFTVTGSGSSAYYVGRPIEIIHPNGYTQTFHYGEHDELTSISDSYGRELAFTWIMQDTALSGSTVPLRWPLAVSKIDLPDGNAISYEYGMLATINTGMAVPMPERLEKVKYLDAYENMVAQRQYHYEDARFPFYMTGVTDERNQRVASWTYDGNGRAISSEGVNGLNHFAVSYDDTEGAEAATVTNPLGKQIAYVFHRDDTILKLQETRQIQSDTTSAVTSSIQYDDRGFVSQKTDEAGNITRYAYSDSGLLESLTKGAGTEMEQTSTTTWHPTLRLPTLIVEPGRETTNVYTAAGLLSSKTVKDTTTNATRTTSYTYTASGQLKTLDGPRTDVSDVTTYDYDSHGNLSKITNALGQATGITAHDGAGRPLTLVDANSVITQLQYDARGRLTSTTTDGKQTRLTYDATGNLQRITMPDGGFFDYGYDAASRLTSVKDALGNTLEYTLDSKGNRTETRIKDVAGVLRNTQRASYDDLDRVLKAIGSQANQATQFTYDRLGNIHTQTDALGNTTTDHYDALNRLTQVEDALHGVTRYAYDSADNLTAVTDPHGNTTRYTYNAFGEQTQEISPDRGTLNYTYDAVGNRTSKTDARGILTRYSYDALNRLTAVEYPTTSLNVSFTYDQGQYGKGRLTRMQDSTGITDYAYDVQGNLLQETVTASGRTWATSYFYDVTNQLIGVTYPSGRIINYIRNQAGQITKVTQTYQGKTEIVADSIAYLPFGSEISRRLGNGLVTTQTYDLDYQLAQISTPAVLSLTYNYDFTGNILGIADNINSSKSQSFTYDKLSRLTQANGAYGNLGYTYDTVGNRLKKTADGKTETYTYAANSNRLLSRDGGLGESTKAIVSVYDNQNRLSKVTADGQNTTYQYNGKGERVSKTHNSTSTRYHYDQEGRLITETQGGIVTAEYIYLNGKLLAFTSQDVNSQPISYVHIDHLGTPKALTNSSKKVIWRVEHKPFGDAIVQQDPEGDGKAVVFNLRFSRQYFDQETGQHYNYLRDYNHQVGRYLSSDPIGINGDLNTYLYGNANPIRFTDPTGEFVPAIAIAPEVGSLIVSGVVIGLGVLNQIYGGSSSHVRQNQKSDEGSCDEDDCKERISDWHLRKQGIDAHELKYEVLGRSAKIARYELCRCNDGQIAIRNKGCTGSITRTGVFFR